MSTPSQSNGFSGVLQGPFGSLVRDQYGIDNSSSAQLFSKEGKASLQRVLEEYREAGATIGGTPTFRLTNQRTFENTEDFDSSEYLNWNREAVTIANAIYGTHQKVGLIAPITDTSGGDDEIWKQLGLSQYSWVRRKQEPQIKALIESGIETIHVEAMRYVIEAEAIADLTKKYGGKRVSLCFEASEAKIPDPDFPNATFAGVKERILDSVSEEIDVRIGANCIGVTTAEQLLENGEKLDSLYPNQLDFGRPGAKQIHKSRFAELAEKAQKTRAETTEFAEYQQILTTPVQEFIALWRQALQQRVQVIGICCGGTPELTRHASRIFKENSVVTR